MVARPEVPLQFVRSKAVQYTPLLAWMLAPVAATGYAMALWRFASDMRWLDEFVIPDGPFSRWQVWLVMAIGVQLAAQRLNRRNGRRDGSLAS